MKRSPTLIPLLATMLLVAACGGGETEQSERPAPTEPRRGQAESAPRSAPEKTAREEATQKRVSPDNEAAQGERGSTPEADESSGLSVTTLQGEQVSLGGQGEVTALYFMAGW